MRSTLEQVARVWSIAAAVGWLALLALTIGIGTGSTAAAATTRPELEQRRDEPQTTTSRIEPRVMCPSCDTTLDHSDSPAAERMRLWVRAAVDAGWTEQEIYDGLVREYGGDESVLAMPRARGAGLLVWIVPAGITLVALLAGIASLRSWRRQTVRSGSSTHSSSRSSSGSSDA